MPLEKRRAHRFQYLRAVYDASDGVAGKFLRYTDVGEELGFDEKHAEELADYLAEEQLIKWAAMGVIELTHYGLKEVEQALSAPDQPTEHFPSLVIAQNYIGSVTNSQVQQGTTASEINVVALGALVAGLRQALTELDLPAEQHDEVEADLATVETQLASPNPKAGIVRESLSSVRRIFEGALGSGLAGSAPHLPAAVEHLARVLSAL